MGFSMTIFWQTLHLSMEARHLQITVLGVVESVAIHDCVVLVLCACPRALYIFRFQGWAFIGKVHAEY